MKLKITSRDKVLLYLLAMVLIIFVGFRYFINPAKARLATLIDTETSTQMEHDIARITVGRVPTLEDNKTRLTAELAELEAGMLAPVYESERIEWMMDDFIGISGLTCRAMTIRPTVADTLYPYGYDKTTGGIAASAVARVEMTTEGTVTAQMRLVENLREDSHITVVSFNISDDGVTAPLMMLVLEILMH